MGRLTVPNVTNLQLTISEAPGHAKVCGILGLILAILGLIVPVVGVLFITPLAIAAGVIALYGQYKGMGIAILIINVLNLLISPFSERVSALTPRLRVPGGIGFSHTLMPRA
jgi:hypothetical protein